MTAVDWALQYVGLGYSVVAVHGIVRGQCTCRNPRCGSVGKHPRTARGVKDASSDPEVVRRWWQRWPTANVGVAIPKGCIVLDVDSAEGLQSALTLGLSDAIPVCRTARGWHYWLSAPPGVVTRSIIGLAPGLDLRAHGTFAVVPPSRHRTGVRYEWEVPLVAPHELPLAPPRLLDLLQPPAPARRDGGREPAVRLDPGAVRQVCAAALEHWEEGHRHDLALHLSGWARKRGLPEEKVAELISAVATEAGDPELPDRLRAVADSYSRPPDQVAGWSQLPQPLREVVDSVGGQPQVMTKFVPRRFSERILEHHRFYSCGDLRTGDFFRYDAAEGLWREDAEAFIANLLREGELLPLEWRKESYVREIIADIRELVWRPVPLPTAPPTLLPFANGVYDLQDDTLRAYRPEDGFFSKLPWPYDPMAESTVLRERLAAFQPNVKRAFWELLAYCLWGGYPMRRAFLWVGGTSTGKSFLQRLLIAALGAENVSHISLHDLETNRFAAAELRHKLLNVSGELSYAELVDTRNFKMLVGGDPIQADRKFRQTVTFINSAKLLFIGNALPGSPDKTDAFYQRLIIVQFEKQFVEDPRVETELAMMPQDVRREELAWLLTTGVGELRRLLDNGFHFTNDAPVDVKRAKYEELADPLSKFIETHCDRTLNSSDYIFKFEFAEALTGWVRSNKLNDYRQRELNKRMRELGFTEGQRGEHKWWAWVGIRWKTPDPPQVTEVTQITVPINSSYTKSELIKNTVTSVTSVTPAAVEVSQQPSGPGGARATPLGLATRAIEQALAAGGRLTRAELRRKTGLPRSLLDEAIAVMLRTGELLNTGGSFQLEEIDDS